MSPALATALIPILVPVFLAGLKSFIPSLPKSSLPVLAPFLGALAEASMTAAGQPTLGGPPWLGAVLGSAGVGIREIVDQVKKAANAPMLPPR